MRREEWRDKQTEDIPQIWQNIKNRNEDKKMNNKKEIFGKCGEKCFVFLVFMHLRSQIIELIRNSK